jgi:hypothetical protein
VIEAHIETANLTWAIEKIYRTLYGEPVFGYEHYLSKNKNKQIDDDNNNHNNDGSIVDNAASSKPLNYTLMTSVPWNWIPFIPVNTTKFLSDPATNPPSHSHIEL